MHLVEEIVRLMKLKDTNAPNRPQRIILLGSPGSKKEQFAARIAEKYNLVYVQRSQLIRDFLRRNADNEFGRQVQIQIESEGQSKY